MGVQAFKARCFVLRLIPVVFSAVMFLFFKVAFIPDGAYLVEHHTFQVVLWLVLLIYTSGSCLYGCFADDSKLSFWFFRFLQPVLLFFAAAGTFLYVSLDIFISADFDILKEQLVSVSICDDGTELIEIPEDLAEPYKELLSLMPATAVTEGSLDVTFVTAEFASGSLHHTNTRKQPLPYIQLDDVGVVGYMTATEPEIVYLAFDKDLRGSEETAFNLLQFLSMSDVIDSRFTSFIFWLMSIFAGLFVFLDFLLIYKEFKGPVDD